jgi:nitrogenase subunit NifH
MAPQLRKKPVHVLSELSVEECSLVDKPSNPYARVAIWKRDSGYLTRDQLRKHMAAVEAARQKVKKEKKMSKKFATVLKSATSRDAICQVVRKQAEKVAKKKGISLAAAEARVWEKHPEAVLQYETAPIVMPVMKSDLSRLRTAADDLDKAVGKLKKKNAGLSFNALCDKALSEDSDLRERYMKELATPVISTIPQTQYFDSSGQQLGQKRGVA